MNVSIDNMIVVKMASTQNASAPPCAECWFKICYCFMCELSYQKWAIWKRKFNLTWDNTSGKVQEKKDSPAESDLIVKWKNIIEVVLFGSFSQMHN